MSIFHPMLFQCFSIWLTVHSAQTSTQIWMEKRRLNEPFLHNNTWTPIKRSPQKHQTQKVNTSCMSVLSNGECITVLSFAAVSLNQNTLQYDDTKICIVIHNVSPKEMIALHQTYQNRYVTKTWTKHSISLPYLTDSTNLNQTIKLPWIISYSLLLSDLLHWLIFISRISTSNKTVYMVEK